MTFATVVALHHAQIAEAVALLFGVLSSHITALLTHVNAPSKVKAPIALAVSVLAGVVATVGWDPGEPWWAWVKTIFFAVLASQGTYLLKDITGVTFSQTKGLSIGGGKLNADDGGYSIIGLVLTLLGGALLIIGAIELLVAAVGHRSHLSVPGLIEALIGLFILAAVGRYSGTTPAI